MDAKLIREATDDCLKNCLAGLFQRLVLPVTNEKAEAERFRACCQLCEEAKRIAEGVTP